MMFSRMKFICSSFAFSIFSWLLHGEMLQLCKWQPSGSQCIGTTEYEELGGACCFLLQEVAADFLTFDVLRYADASHTPFRHTDVPSVHQMLIYIV